MNKLSISNIAWTEEWDQMVYEKMAVLGYQGLEIAPTRIFHERPYEDLESVSSWYEDFSKRFVIPSMQSILYGVSDSIFQDEAQRDRLFSYLCRAVDFAQVISCKNLVFGCPRNRNGYEGRREIALDFFHRLGEYAWSHGTVIGMEPVPRSYNTDFLNTTAETIAFVREVDSQGFKMNLDVGALLTNGEDLSVIDGNVDIINHVQISEPGLKPIEERPIHIRLRDLLADYGFDRYVSIEMGKQDDISALISCMEYISTIFLDK